MSDFKSTKASNSISAGALPQTPLGELTMPPQTSALCPPSLETTCLPKYVPKSTCAWDCGHYSYWMLLLTYLLTCISFRTGCKKVTAEVKWHLWQHCLLVLSGVGSRLLIDKTDSQW